MCSVITLYFEGGGKAGRHDWVPQLPAEYRPTLVCWCSDLSTAGFSMHPLRRGADWSFNVCSSCPGVILVRIAGSVSLTDRAADMSKKTAALFIELSKEKAALVRTATALTTVRREGKANVNILDVEEDDGVDD
ncbi:hypothetical protein GGX14DRAFT_393526 [Mycena pura]|uniref:Uncharacterized protein n=1 Tax=Mycena pura TaxID=153505 RepID=A0AAD6YEM6_9AGAR|nr:hypothetical protein GGX14DRAFT_393526 [Mycena pura]